jgi:hypothetical protein
MPTLFIRFHRGFFGEGVVAGGAGDKEHALTDIGHAAKIEPDARFLAGRAGQARQPVRCIGVCLADRTGGDAQFERIGAADASDRVLRVRKALLAARMDGEVRFVTDRTLERGQARQDLFQVDHLESGERFRFLPLVMYLWG